MQTLPRREVRGSVERLERELSMLIRLAPVLRQATATDGLALEQPTYALLGWLYDHGSFRISDLATGFHLDVSTVSRQVSAAERDGYLVREPDPADGRAHRLHITPEGERALRADRSRRRRLLRRLLCSWDPADRSTLADLTAQLNDGIHAQFVESAPASHRQKVQLTP